MSERSTVVEGKKVSGLDETEADTRPSSSSIQRTIGRFAIERELGAGGMGVVLLAHDPTLDRKVAIKLLHDDRGAGSSGRVRMLREAQAMAKLRHPNVVTVYEAGIQDANVYLVMELIEGGTLRTRLPSLDAAATLRVFGEAGHGLAAAHRAGLVHRDFKPDNVLIDEHGHAKVTDFGLAARDDSVEETPRTSAPELDALSQTLTRTGAIMGTPRYMAPEQHLAQPTDARTDQFSFCVALYEALFDEHPFQSQTRESLMESVVHDRPRVPEPRGIPSRTCDAVMRGLSREPRDRFPDMEALLAELVPPRKRMPMVALGLGLMAAGAIAFAATRSGEDPAITTRRIAQELHGDLVDLQLPANTHVTGVRAITRVAVTPAFPALWMPTGQLAIPRGTFAIEYRDDVGSYAYAVSSRGEGATRTIALPAPAQLAGFTFIPGGDVEIGDATIQLAPYLIATTAPDLHSYDDALQIAADRHARLPTAGEWEWAARLGMTPAGWEWTGSQFAPYPYAADDRDDPFTPRDASEVRDGSTRRAGSHRGKAHLRLVRSAVVAPIEAITLELTAQETAATVRKVLSPREHLRMSQFVLAWIQRPDRPALQLQNGNCAITTTLTRAGVPYAHLDETRRDNAPTVLRTHPDRSFTRPTRIVICDDETVELDAICFQGEQLHPDSSAIIAAVAQTLAANPALDVEVQAYVGQVTDALAVSQRRAELVRARLVAAGVAPSRLRAKGFGVGDDASSTEHGLFATAPAKLPANCTALPGERIAFAIVRR